MFVSQDVNKTQRGVLYFLNILISKFLHRAATRSRHPSQGLLSFLSQPCTAPCIWICIIIVGFVIRGNVATWIVILVPSSFLPLLSSSSIDQRARALQIHMIAVKIFNDVVEDWLATILPNFNYYVLLAPSEYHSERTCSSRQWNRSSCPCSWWSQQADHL